MKIKLLFLFLVIGTAISAVLYLAPRNEPDQAPNTASPTQAQTETRVEVANGDIKERISAKPTEPGTNSVAEAPPSEVNQVDELDEDIQLDWQRKAGFPDVQTHSEYFRKPYEDLRTMAEDGDVLAMQILGSKLSHEGDREEAIDWLTEAVSEGSIAAALDLSQGYKSSRRLGPDRVNALAWQRVAEAMGAAPDVFTPIELERREDRAAATMLFHEYWASVQESYKAKYGVPIPFHSQPTNINEG